jgi:hypothetical protein
VARPGGTIALTARTPEGLNRQLFVAMGRHTPPSPDGFRRTLNAAAEYLLTVARK